MAYPSTIDSFSDPQGTNTLSSPDHAQLHTDINSAVEQLESVVGTTQVTGALNSVPVGKTLVYSTGGTFNDGVLGTPNITGGTLQGAVVGTTEIVGGTATNILFTAGTIAGYLNLIGTTQIIGGTLTSNVINNPTVGTPQITGGTLASASIGTPTIIGGTILINGTSVPLSFGAAIVPTVGTIADSAGGTLTANAQAYQIASISLGTSAGNRTIGTPNNPTAGQALTYRIKDNGNSNATLVWSSIFRMSADIGTPTIGTGSSWNYYGWRYNATDSKWDFVGYQKNIV